MRISACLLAAIVLPLSASGCGDRSGAALTPAAAGLPDAGTRPTPSATLWIPAAGSTFAIQYGGKTLDTNVNASIYDVDGFDTTAATVAQLHGQGRRVVCYIDVGTWENWRSDAGKFPKSVLGKPDGHWPGERWLDISQLPVLQPIMSARFKMCKRKGFDAVDPDNIDGFENHTGFKLTAGEQLTYDRWVAKRIHSFGLSAAQKNDNDQVRDLRPSFDWAVLEQCYKQGWCQQFTSYTDDGRLVVDIEYGLKKSEFLDKTCPADQGYKETALLKHLNLDAWVVTCSQSP